MTAVSHVPVGTVHRARRPGSMIVRWMTTTDHKVIGNLYLVTSFAFFLFAGVLAMFMRAELARPGTQIMTNEQYNQAFTMHGTIMLLFFATPLFVGFANAIMPLQIGAPDVAFPRLNMFSYWLFLFGGLIVVAGYLTPDGAASFGWFAYSPLNDEIRSPNIGSDLWIMGLAFSGFGTILGAVNFITTIICMRAPGMTMFRMPVFTWNILLTSVLVLMAFPVLAAALLALEADRKLGAHVFEAATGGPILWQHLFWFFGHPEVYIIALPFFGIVTEILPVFSRKPIFGYKAIAAATIGIAFLSLLVWAHHMFATPLSTAVLAFFMLSSMIIAIPTGIKIFNWIATLWRGTLEFKTPLYFGVGFLAFFTLGGVSGVMLAIFPLDWQLTDTYFVVAHFHYVLVAGAVNAIFAGLYYWFPKMTGRMLSEGLGKTSFWLTFVGFNVTFLVQHSLGLEGMPRRVYEYADTGNLHALNLISTVGAFILASGVLVTVYNVLRSLRRGAVAGPDPWKANTLEWFTTSPPPANNFDVVPRVRSVEPMKDIRRTVARATGETSGRTERQVRA